MRAVKALLLFVFLIPFLPGKVSAQSIDDGGLWFAAFGNGDIEGACFANRRVKWWFDAHYRLLDDAGGFNQSIVRPGIGLDMGNKSALWAGYGWIHSSPIQGNNFDEHRLWQQWTWAPEKCGIKYLHRSRFEQRFVETGDDTGLRWRQLFRVQGRANCGGYSPVFWNEAFFNLNDTDWGAQSGFDQNRMFLGVRLPKKSRFFNSEIGYLNQAIHRGANGTRVNHILSVNFFF